MNKFCRLAITCAVCSVYLSSPGSAQTRGPIADRSYEPPSSGSEITDAVHDANGNAQVGATEKKSRWPLNLGRRLFKKGESAESAADPFLAAATKGAEEQKRLAVELSSQAGQSVKNVLQNAQGGIQNLATISQAGGAYPWPIPVVSKTGGPSTPSVLKEPAADGSQTALQPSSDRISGSRPRIVDAVRAANERIVDRFGGTSQQSPLTGAGRDPLAAAQTAQSAENLGTTNFSQQAVDKYMQRVTAEGTANGRVFNPLAAVKAEAATAVAGAGSQMQAAVQQGLDGMNAVQQVPQQIVQQFQQQAAPYITGVQSAPSSGIRQLGNASTMAPPASFVPPAATTVTQSQPTFTGYPAATPTAQVAAIGQPLPSHVQPRTQYVPNMTQTTPGTSFVGPTNPVTPLYAAGSVVAPTLPNAGNSPNEAANAIPTSSAMAGSKQSVQAVADSNAFISNGAAGLSVASNEPSRASSFPLGDVQTASAVLTPATPSPSFNTPSNAVPQVLPNQQMSTGAPMNSMPVSNTMPPGTSGIAAASGTRSAVSNNVRSGLGNPDESTRVLAIVGDQSVLAGDVMSQVGQMLEPYRQEMTDEQFQQQADLLIQKLLPRLVENKLVYIDFMRTVPPDKLPELRAKVFEFFSEKQLPELQTALGVESTLEVDAKLREMGSSLAKQQQMFLEKFVGREAVRRNVDVTAEITHDELLEYFHAHPEEFSFATQAKWERLSVEIGKFDSRDAAHNALAQLGNAVQNGEDFAAVAKRGSNGPRADEGGQYDWTTEGSLRANVVSELVFSLPPGRLSSIVEADGSLHIVRVVERREAGVEKFADVQAKISEKIKEQRYSEGAKEYLDRLTRETYVWTVYESSAAGSAPVQMASPPAASGNWQ